MTWVRTDDSAPLHRKFFRAGVSAYGWWHAGLSYCNHHLTDGFIPARDLDRIFPGTPHETLMKIVKKLITEQCLHEVTEGVSIECHSKSKSCPRGKRCENGYVMHDYFDYQPRKKVVLEHRRWRSKAGRQGGEKSAETRKQNASHSDKQDASHGANPVPSRPVRRSNTPPISPSPNGIGFAEWWKLYPRKAAPDAAERAWRTAVKKSSADELLAALKRQLPDFARRPKDRVPYPATWLNGGHWRNEPDDASGADDNPYAGWPTLHDCGACERGCHETLDERDECRAQHGLPALAR